MYLFTQKFCQNPSFQENSQNFFPHDILSSQVWEHPLECIEMYRNLSANKTLQSWTNFLDAHCPLNNIVVLLFCILGAQEQGYTITWLSTICRTQLQFSTFTSLTTIRSHSSDLRKNFTLEIFLRTMFIIL